MVPLATRSIEHAYHIQHALRLNGTLNIEGIYAAFDGLLRRHGALRAIFRVGADGSPEQIIQPMSPFEISCVDLRESPLPEREARAAEEARRFCSVPFDLTQGPLLRVALIQIAGDENILVMVMHHIVSDGASMQLFIDELSARYLGTLKEELSTSTRCLSSIPIMSNGSGGGSMRVRKTGSSSTGATT